MMHANCDSAFSCNQLQPQLHNSPDCYCTLMLTSSVCLSVRCRLSKSFGYMNKDGFCSGTTCHVFAVVLGEFNVKMDSAVSTG